MAETPTATIITNKASFDINRTQVKRTFEPVLTQHTFDQSRYPLLRPKHNCISQLKTYRQYGTCHCPPPPRERRLLTIQAASKSYIRPSSAQASTKSSNALVYAQVGHEATLTEDEIKDVTTKSRSPLISTASSSASSYASSDDDDKEGFLPLADLKE